MFVWAIVADVDGCVPWRYGGLGIVLVVTGLSKRVAQPFKTLVQAISARGAGGLNVLQHVSYEFEKKVSRSTYPSALSEAVETELVGNLSSVHGILHSVSVTLL